MHYLHANVREAERRHGIDLVALAHATEPHITLDGEPAYVAGFLCPFAGVSRCDGKGGHVEYSWNAVANVLTGDRAFKS